MGVRLSIIEQAAVLNLPRISLDALKEDAGSELELHLIQPRTIVKCDKPIAFHCESGLKSLPWMLSPSEYYTYASYYLRIMGGHVSPQWGAVFTRAGSLIDDSVQAAKWADPSLSNIPGVIKTEVDYSIKSPGRVIDEKCVLLNHWGSHNYGHFIIDCLSGILPIIDLIRERNFKVLSKPLAHWQKELLTLINVPVGNIIEVNDDLCQVKELIFPSFLGGNLDHPSNSTRIIFDTLRQRCSEAKDTRASRRILIDRSNHPSRKLSNWSEVVNAALQSGFDIVKTENMSVREQIETFSNAEIVVGETGAAMTNIGFCDPRTHFIEIMLEGRESAWLKNTAAMIGRRWSCMYCKTENIDSSLLYKVDINSLQKMIADLLRE